MGLIEDLNWKRRISYLVFGIFFGAILGGTIMYFILKGAGWDIVIIRILDFLDKVLQQGGTSALFYLLGLIVVAFITQYRIRHDRKHYSSEIKRIADERNELQKFILGQFERQSTQKNKKE